MNLLQSIHPSKPLRYLKWFDILIITVLMFGEFIIRSTQQFMESLSPSTLTSVAETTTNLASDGAAYSSNFNFQLMMLGITFLYLVIRNYDFKQLPIRWSWSILIWVPLIFALVGILGDIVTTLSGEYNYFNSQLIPFIDPMEIIRKFMALTPMAICYALLNGFYEDRLTDFSKRKAQMVGFGLLGNYTDFFPYLSRIALGLGDWACLWSLLLFLVQVCSQEFTAILSHACSSRYVWIQSLVSFDCLGKLRNQTF